MWSKVSVPRVVLSVKLFRILKPEPDGLQLRTHRSADLPRTTSIRHLRLVPFAELCAVRTLYVEPISSRCGLGVGRQCTFRMAAELRPLIYWLRGRSETSHGSEC